MNITQTRVKQYNSTYKTIVSVNEIPVCIAQSRKKASEIISYLLERERDFDKFYSEYIQMHEGDIFTLTNGALKYAMKKCGLAFECLVNSLTTFTFEAIVTKFNELYNTSILVECCRNEVYDDDDLRKFLKELGVEICQYKTDCVIISTNNERLFKIQSEKRKNRFGDDLPDETVLFFDPDKISDITKPDLYVRFQEWDRNEKETIYILDYNKEEYLLFVPHDGKIHDELYECEEKIPEELRLFVDILIRRNECIIRSLKK